jgi:NADH-quinone oxidoreductase subunit J
MLQTGENGYALPFEVVTILLLAAMVGCIVIAIKTPAPSTKLEANENGQGKLEDIQEKELIE